ncbi:MAG TPA: STAS/SEC14 domain-containing protein [Syntrophobacteraceae bacterium]|nr:STAS/SEC14 domain-containing protein [Syntrophobacteraceae bacterium]
MIELLDLQLPGVVGMRICGRVEKADILRVARAAEETLSRGFKLKVYVELESLEGVSLEAFVEDLRFALPHLKDFKKKAVVSDKGWLTRLGEMTSRFFPAIEVRHFSWEEKQQAREWVAS